jgi:hypothetical protein
MISSYTILILLFSIAGAHETKPYTQRNLQQKCAPNCLWGNVCGPCCDCSWPNCVWNGKCKLDFLEEETKEISHEETIPDLTQNLDEGEFQNLSDRFALITKQTNCVCNFGDRCCCPPNSICCNTPGRCCCRFGKL